MAGTYEGRAFHKDLPNGKATGPLRLEDGLLSFSAQGQSAALPLAGMTIERGGAAQRLIFFKNPAQPDWTLLSAQGAILKDPEITSNPHLVVQIRRMRRAGLKSSAFVAAVCVSFLAVLFGLFALKDPLAGFVADRIPPKWEIKLGAVVFAQITGTGKMVESPAANRQFDSLVAPLVSAIPDKRYEFTFHIADKSEVNAFALPGGHVIVNSGLILKADTPEEVLGVLAHEIAHVTRRHTVRQLIQTAGVYILVQALFGDMTGLVAVAADQGAFLASRKFSRGFERDADETGWSYLVASDTDPRGMAAFFRKLDKKKGGLAKIEGALSFMSTHPAAEERAAYLDKKWETSYKGHRFRKIELDFAGFQRALRDAGAKKNENDD